MVIHKRKKNTRQRGSHTHGWGSKKKHRGAGNRGGKGMAGTGKRADSMKPSIWKNIKYFGKFGFVKKGSKEKIIPINIAYFEEHLDKLFKDKKIEQKDNFYVVNLNLLGFNKLLGTGKPTKKFKFITKYASKGAIEKVKKSGGEVVVQEKINIPDQENR